MDGAKIHCDAHLIAYLRSLGLIVIFLPAYAPFFNPIEILFGLMKRRMRLEYTENAKEKLELFIAGIVKKFCQKNMTKLYRKCGYIRNGVFDPSIGLKQNIAGFGFGS